MAGDPEKLPTTFDGAPASTAAIRADRIGPGVAWQDAVALGVDLARAVETAVKDNRLSTVERLALYLHFAEGWETDEIADRLDMSYAQVRRSLKRALKALQETGLLQGYEQEYHADKR